MTPEAFFAGEARKPFRWGETDCVATFDRWCRAVCGRSPIEASGLSWASEAEAEAILGRLCLPIRVARAMRKCGLAVTGEPAAGDVAAIAIGDMLTIAVRGSRHWFYRRETGGVTAAIPDVRMLMAWRVA